MYLATDLQLNENSTQLVLSSIKYFYNLLLIGNKNRKKKKNNYTSLTSETVYILPRIGCNILEKRVLPLN